MPSKNTRDLIGSIYDTTLRADLWPEVLEQIMHVIGAAAAHIYWQDIDMSASVNYSCGNDSHYTELYLSRYKFLNPFYPAAAFFEQGEVFSGADLCPHDEFRQTRFYKEWVAPQNWIDAIGLSIQRYPTGHACLSLQRGVAHGVADQATLRKLELIAPHVIRAVLIGRHIHQLEARARGYEAVLDAHSASVFLVGDQGHLIFANASGQAMLDAERIVSVRDRILAFRNPAAAQLLTAATSGNLLVEHGRRSVAIPLTDTPPRWLADVLPLRSGNRLGLARETGASAAIFVRRAEIPAASGIEIMAQIYQLRASEVRVLHALTQGCGSNEELGLALGISAGTVKTHLNALFSKTGTGRREELLREVAAHGGPLL